MHIWSGLFRRQYKFFWNTLAVRPVYRSGRAWSGRFSMARAKGFSLIELLVVIAIVIILAAMIFPVYVRTKDAAYRGADMAHMNEIRSALQLYRVEYCL